MPDSTPAPLLFRDYAEVAATAARDLIGPYADLRPDDVDINDPENAFADMICDLGHGLVEVGRRESAADPLAFAVNRIASGLAAFLHEHTGSEAGAQDAADPGAAPTPEQADAFAEALRVRVRARIETTDWAADNSFRRAHPAA